MTHSYIWCEQCDLIRALAIVDTHADVGGLYHQPRDLTCATCGYVVATLFNAKPLDTASEGS